MIFLAWERVRAKYRILDLDSAARAPILNTLPVDLPARREHTATTYFDLSVTYANWGPCPPVAVSNENPLFCSALTNSDASLSSSPKYLATARIVPRYGTRVAHGTL